MPKSDLRFSRWGRSSYETDDALSAEAEALRPLLQPVPFRQDAELVAVNSRTRVDGALLDMVPSARLVVTTTSGYDHLDLAALGARGVLAARLPMARRDAVVESALGMLLEFFRRHGELRRAAVENRWVRGALPGLGQRTLAGARVGVVGLGVIGARMAEILTLLGAEVVGADPLPHAFPVASLEEMLATCDAITLHCRLTPESRGMLSRERLLAARRGLVLINTARGGLVDVDGAVAALEAGVLGGLGVDVFPEEPWPRLWQNAGRDNLLFTPHAAGYHHRLTEQICAGLVACAQALVAGQPIPWILSNESRG